MTRSIEQRAADTIRVLSMDAVERANSGHPGMPMGMADIAVVLWSKFLNVDPADPTWRDRDRFVLSNGHGSMLLYSLLHLSGFPLSMEEIENFRQWGYETAGHPEYAPAIGIETTTGPLGQGFGVAVGMAMAEARLRAVFGADLTDHHTYVFCGDGDLMEGVSAEAASLAGHLGLGKLIVFYDDNEITIDGATSLAFSEDVPARFAAYGWETLTVDGHDRPAIAAAIEAAHGNTTRPTLISCKTHIAYGAPTKVDTAKAHGSPLGADEIAATKEQIGWDLPPFTVPDDVYAFFRSAMRRGSDAKAQWRDRVGAVGESEPDRLAEYERWWIPPEISLDAPPYDPGSSVATRKQSEAVIQQLAKLRPDVIGGSADLAGSNNTLIAGSPDFSREDHTGRNVRYGIREHGMGAVLNGMNQHGGMRAFGGTFLTFSDYMRPSVRLAALMGTPSIFVWTHDSIFLGEDGPTHQSVEHVEALRLIPGLDVVRPADPAETAFAWEHAVNRVEGPTGIILTRQGLPIPSGAPDPEAVARGAYIRRPGTDVVVVATGSEVALAVDTAELAAEEGVSIRVVSMPSMEVFDRQDDAYRSTVLGDDLPIFTLEAGVTRAWRALTGHGGVAIGIDRFGASAPAGVLAEQYGFTPRIVWARIAEAIDGQEDR